MLSKKKRRKDQAICHLSGEEINHPGDVLKEFFDYASLPEVRLLLWEWFRTTVTGTFNKSLNRRERYDIARFYEQLQKLIEACHLINQCHDNND
jgi:phosphatidate phosphatase APP1